MAEQTVAEIFLIAARRDEQAFRKLAEDPSLHDSLAGLYAQQAVETALKSVLAKAGVVFRRTHDIAELLDVLEDAGLAAPPYAGRLDELSPYAVEHRCGLNRAQRAGPDRHGSMGARGHRLGECSDAGGLSGPGPGSPSAG